MLAEPVDIDAERGLAYGYGWYLEERDGRLYIDPDGQGRYQLHAASEHDFFLREGDVEVTFVRSEDGAITGLLFRQSGQEVPAERLE